MSQGERLRGVRVLAVLRGFELFGHERGNIEVFKVLRSLGAEVCVAVTTTNDGGAVRTELEQLAFQTVSMPFGFQWSKQFFKAEPHLILVNFRYWTRCHLAFHRAVKEFRPTHVHMGNPLAFNFVELAVRWHRLPMVVRMGDAAPADSAVQMFMWRRYIRRSARVIANSKYIWDNAATYATELRSRAPLIIPNLAPTSSHPPVDPGLDPRFRHVVYLGQLTREKGVFQFVEAAHRLHGRYPDVKFHLVGGSEHSQETEAELRALAKSLGLDGTVQFHGWVGNARLFLARADVHAAPSLFADPSANVVLEAKREGTPTVVFPSGGLPELIRHEVDGVVCREPSSAALAEGLAWTLDRMRDRPTLRAEVQADFQARFGLARFERAWAEIYAPRDRLSN
ncbi:MAG: glycosyltransferase [Proteobacteria bacterium]|nr:glycosyltransferase [Pseudomonadota bacterium]